MGRAPHRPEAVFRVGPRRSGAYHVCGRRGAPAGRRIVAIAGNGNCLYHAVARSLLRGRRQPTLYRRVAVGDLRWLTGRYAHTAGGSYAKRGEGLRGALHRALRAHRGRARGDAIARAMERAYAHTGATTAGAALYDRSIERTGTRKAWGELAEIVALAVLLRTRITVFQCQADERWTVWTVQPSGAVALRTIGEGARPRPERGVELLNCDGHFEPLVACAPSVRGLAA
jgi:hypothetical protein